MKTLRLQIPTFYPYYHRFAEMQTCYKDSILSGNKIHSIQKLKYVIEEIKQEINQGNTILKLWEYTNSGYGTQAETFATILDTHYSELIKKAAHWYVGKWKLPIKEQVLAANEGLTVQAFNGLWPERDYNNLTIIYFTDFQYEDCNDKKTLIQHLKNFEQCPSDCVKLSPSFFGDITMKTVNHYDR
jgi:hypothetical protein